MRLHLGMGLERRRVGHVEHDGRLGEGCLDVADGRIGRGRAAVLGLESLLLVTGEVDHDRVGSVADVDRISRGSRLLEGLRHHYRDGLPVMIDAIARERRRDLRTRFAGLRRILVREHREDARHLLGHRSVERGDPSLGDGRGYEVADRDVGGSLYS